VLRHRLDPLLVLLLPLLSACSTGTAEPLEGPDLSVGKTVDERIVYYDVLGEPGKVDHVPLLERAIGRDHVEVQLTVIEALGRISAPEVIPVLEKAAKDELVSVRRAVAQAASSIRCPEAVALVERLARDPSIKVRRVAVNTLACYGDPGSVDLLIELARGTEDETIRNAAVQALGTIGPPAAPALPLLIELATVEKETIRWDAVEAIHMIGSEEAIQALGDQLTSDLPEIRGRSALALAKLEAPGALEKILVALATERDDLAAASMARSAALLGAHEASIPVLQRIVQRGRHWTARVEAAIALGESGGSSSRPMLEEARRDSNSEVRKHAAEAIALIRSREVSS
jgi:HEAT repeat protein